MSLTFERAGDLPVGMPMYGSRNNDKNARAETPCHCGSHSIRIETGECAACWSRANRMQGVGGVKPLPLRSKIDDLMMQKKLEKELSDYDF